MAMKEIICIVCPLGCKIEAIVSEQRLTQLKNAVCKRGEEFAREEIENPIRIITSTVKLAGASWLRLPVRTSHAVPKSKIFDCMQALDRIILQAPVKVGDVVLRNVAGTGADIIATRSMSQL